MESYGLEKSGLVESIIQFGSSLYSANPEDIDLCVIPTKPLSLSEKLSLSRGLPEKIDLSFIKDLPVHIRKEVLGKGKIIYTRNYYRVLELMKETDLEFIQYKRFLEDYHKCQMTRT